VGVTLAEKKIKFDIDNGQSFFADEAGVIHNPLKIILDFRSITPRVDVRNNEYQPLVLRHNVIVMDPYTAKSLSDMLQENIKNYEKQFGKIEKPAGLKKAEKEAKKDSKKDPDAPGYFG
jgi:hypothetical protein